MEKFTGNGFLNIFKPVGMTSHDASAYVRRALGRPKTGHAGTLDPAACGVLVLLLNGATKLSARAMSGEKTYRAEMTFGVRTDTADAQGEIIEEREADVTRESLEAALRGFTGEITQIPPMTSAIKIGGKKLYKLAHKGQEIERPPRSVTVHSIELIDFDAGGANSTAVIEVRCSSGLYVRTLVEDVAAAAGQIAFMSFLVRTAVGPFRHESAVPPDAVTPETVERLLIPPDFLQ